MLPPTVASSPAPPQAGAPFPGTLTPHASAGLVRTTLPPALKPVFSPWDVLQALQRRWLLALVLGLLAAGGAVVGAYYVLLEPDRKMTAAQVWLFPFQPFEFHEPPPDGPGVYEALLASEAALAASEEVVRRALADPELEKLLDFSNLPEIDRIQWIRPRLSVFGNEKDGSITIALRSDDNDRWLMPICNALYKAFMEASHAREKATREQYLANRTEIWLKNGGNFIRELFEEQAKRAKVPPTNYEALANRLDYLNATLTELHGEAGRLRAGMGLVQIDWDLAREELGSTAVTLEEVQVELDADETLSGYINDVVNLQIQIPKLIKGFSDGEKNSVVQGKMADLRSAVATLEEYQGRRTKEIHDVMVAQKEWAVKLALRDYDRELNRKRRQLEPLDKQIAKQLEDITAVQVQIQSIPGNPHDTTIAVLEEKIKAQGAPLDKLTEEIHRLTKEKDAGFRLQPKYGAVPTATEVPPSQARKIGVAGGIAFLAVVVGISLLEYRTRRIHTAHEVVQGLGIRLLGAIPNWSHSRQRAGYGNGNALAYNLWTESVDTARTLVTHAAQAEAARIVMVTSATSGEGKTSLASHLASSLARAGHRTLLVDGDLRSPAVHALFDLPLAPGLCEVLRGQATVEEAVQATPARGLALLTAGQWDADALQGLAQGAGHDVFAQLKEQYDYVIVDSSPVLAVADALMIGRHVDGVLLSILRDVSRVPTVYAAYQRLSMMGISTLGAVVNGARSERYGSWYNAAPASS